MNHNQTINTQLIDDIFLSKEDFASAIDISVHTVQNWLNTHKAEDKDIKITKGKKKSYTVAYLKNLLEKNARTDLVKLLVNHILTIGQVKQTNPNHLSQVNINHSQEIVNQIKQAYESQIESLKVTIGILERELISKNDQLISCQKIIENEQTLKLVEKNKPHGLLGLLGSFGNGINKKAQ